MSETNAARLHVIKDTHGRRIRLSTEAIDYLVKQAERAQNMKKEFANDIDFKRKEVHGLQVENKRLREALAFYADSKNYEINVVDQWGPEIKVMMDGGAKAAELLEGLK